MDATRVAWQYRTIVFEFAKDGLLGERYIDDEEMEKTLNSQGLHGWELVSAVMIQDGVLAVLKRPGQKDDRDVTIQAVIEPSEEQVVYDEEQAVFSAEQIKKEEIEHIRTLEKKRQDTMQQGEHDQVGDIKIS